MYSRLLLQPFVTVLKEEILTMFIICWYSLPIHFNFGTQNSAERAFETLASALVTLFVTLFGKFFCVSQF